MHIVSYIIIGIIILIYFSAINFYNTGVGPIDYILRSLYHANLTHLTANMVSLYALSLMEDIIGQTQFLLAILFIWIISSILLYIYHMIFPSRKVYTVGFSGVIFGLIVVYYFLLGRSTAVTLTGLIVSIIPQIFIRGISFEGHIAGIISGFIYVYMFAPKKKN